MVLRTEILTAAIAVMDESRLRSARDQRLIESFESEFLARIRGTGMTNDLAREEVEHDREVEPALAGSHERDVGDPDLVRSLRRALCER